MLWNAICFETKFELMSIKLNFNIAVLCKMINRHMNDSKYECWYLFPLSCVDRKIQISFPFKLLDLVEDLRYDGVHSIVSYSHTVFLVVNLGQTYFRVIIYRLCLYTKSVPIGLCFARGHWICVITSCHGLYNTQCTYAVLLFLISRLWNLSIE